MMCYILLMMDVYS